MADTHSCRKDAFYGARQKNSNDYRPKCRPMIPVSRNIRHTRIFAGFLGEGASNKQRSCQRRQFSAISAATSTETLEIMPHYYMAIRPNFHYANLLRTFGVASRFATRCFNLDMSTCRKSPRTPLFCRDFSHYLIR